MPEIAQPNEINGDIYDRFSVGHAAWGMVLGAADLSQPQMWAAAIGWEALEYPLKELFPKVFPRATQDRFPNMVGDVAAVAFGWWVVQYYKRKNQEDPQR